MDLGAWSALEWLALIENELLLFAGVFFLLGAADEIAMDVIWMWLRATDRVKTHRVSRSDLHFRQLSGKTAVLIPAWQEAAVISHTLAHALRVWKQRELVVYVGCYRNDPATLEAAVRGAGGDPRVRIVVHDREGPTTKADCLNRLYQAMEQDEARRGVRVRAVMLHDAEDMVDGAALALIDRAIEQAEFVQIPVLPMPRSDSRWIGSHYCEEFAESHGKAMVVRNALAASLPAAGVGCAFEREMLGYLAAAEKGDGPFSDEALTEDYELGLRIAAVGGRSNFLRVRGEDGELVATRSHFPSSLPSAVRQKARWMHGIAFQGWDRLGWSGGIGEWWMRLRDRRGPLSALVLFTGYTLLVLAALLEGLRFAGFGRPWEPSTLVYVLLSINLAAFAWRAVMRFAFTRREYGTVEGIRAVLRIPVANIISIMAGRRALFAYARSLGGNAPVWDKTVHDSHPAGAMMPEPAR